MDRQDLVFHSGTDECAAWLYPAAGDSEPAPAIVAARRAPRGELRTYPGVDHFDVYDGPEHEALVADQVDFLRRHLTPLSSQEPEK